MYDQNLALTNGAPARQTQMAALSIVNTMYKKISQEGFYLPEKFAIDEVARTFFPPAWRPGCAGPETGKPRRAMRRQRGLCAGDRRRGRAQRSAASICAMNSLRKRSISCCT